MIIFTAFGGGLCLDSGKYKLFRVTPGEQFQTPKRSFMPCGFKHGYMRGFIDASTSDVMKYNDQKILASLTPAQKKQWEMGALGKDKSGGPVTMSSKSALILAAALSTFYADEQNASICWQQAMGFKPSEEELAAARCR